MAVIVVTLAIAVMAGVISWVVVGRWPRVDPAAPRVSATTISDTVAHHRHLRSRLRAIAESRLDPASATGLGLTVALVAVVAGALGVGVLLAMIHTETGLARWDSAASRWGAAHATTLSTDALRAVTQLGGTELVVLLTVIVGVAELWRTRRPAVAAFLITVLAGVSIVFNGVKWLVDRARPDFDQLVGFAGASFPSGHAATAAAAFAAFALLLGRGRSHRTKQFLVAAAAAITAAVAASRVLLGVHWFTDVVAGALLGWGWFALCSIAFGGRLLRFGAPVQVAEDIAEASPA